MKAHPDDILLVAWLRERQNYPQFAERQVVTLDTLHRMLGRPRRQVWITAIADAAITPQQAQRLYGEYVRPIEDWQPERASVLEQLAALPEQNASSSRDFGRGYAQAIRDAIAVITNQLTVELEPPREGVTQ